MRLIFAVSSIAVALTLTGCIPGMGGFKSTPDVVNTRTTNLGTNTQAAKSIQTVQLNEAAVAGDITHTITTVETMDAIPASATISTYSLIAEESPAAEGFQWLNVQGTIQNNSKQSQVVNSFTFYIIDSQGNEFAPLTAETILYIEENKAPVALSVQPSQMVEWETYFLVPQDATNLRLVATDLAYIPRNRVMIDLGL